MLQIADHCPALEDLAVGDNERITVVSLEALGAKCPKLKKVYMRIFESKYVWVIRVNDG